MLDYIVLHMGNLGENLTPPPSVQHRYNPEITVDWSPDPNRHGTWISHHSFPPFPPFYIPHGRNEQLNEGGIRDHENAGEIPIHSSR